VENVVGQLGALEVLFNCASHDPELGIEQISRIEATFRGSVFAYLYLMTAALPYLPDGGCVINSSSLGTGPAPADPGHAAAECAIVALTQSFARAAASRGIRVNAVACAVYRMDPQPPGDRAANRSPAHKRGESSGDAGAACVFLACSDSQHISGQILRLDLEHSTRA
ncbi:MAG: SDR family oxidoreductase, partial [Pseudoxanthomonas sp.]